MVSVHSVDRYLHPGENYEYLCTAVERFAVRTERTGGIYPQNLYSFGGRHSGIHRQIPDGVRLTPLNSGSSRAEFAAQDLREVNP